MPHPDLEAEQAYIRYAYECVEGMRNRLAGLHAGGAHPGADREIERILAERLKALEDKDEALCFGRIDEVAGSTWYIGRLGVEDDDREPVVVDWRANVAIPFYRATPDKPLGIWLRRRFTISPDGRELIDISDDLLTDAPKRTRTKRAAAKARLTPSRTKRAAAKARRTPAKTARSVPPTTVDDLGILGRDALLADLGRRRSGEMRDIVATIQAEQDRIMRSEPNGILLVQGGPGTGKTAIGLHRAAWLLYTNRERFERDRILVVGPNPAFMEYIAKVLPSLGEAAVTQLPVTGLAQTVKVERSDAPPECRLKGDGRLADVIRRALDDRIDPLDADVTFNFGSTSVTLTVSDSAKAVEKIRRRRRTYNEGREALRDELSHLLTDRFVRAGSNVKPEEAEEQRRRLRRSVAFENALNRMWITLTPQQLLRDLFGGRRRLAAAGKGFLSPAEQELLRIEANTPIDEVKWSEADLPLLDEAAGLIAGGQQTFGHVVIDEAQDLSPMQLRMIARRCPRGSMTLLGDLAQATGAWAHDSWDEVLTHLTTDGPVVREELTIGYRVPGEVLDLAARLLPFAAPEVSAPRSVRRGKGTPSIDTIDSAELLTEAVRRSEELTAGERNVGLIVPDADLAAARLTLEFAGADYGEALDDGLGQPITLVPAWATKGLEFDAAVVVEPAAIAEESDHGLRLLYVALTRVTQELVVVHSRPLPRAMTGSHSEPEDSDGVAATTGLPRTLTADLLDHYRSLNDAALTAHLRAATDVIAERLDPSSGTSGASKAGSHRG